MDLAGRHLVSIDWMVRSKYLSTESGQFHWQVKDLSGLGMEPQRASKGAVALEIRFDGRIGG